MTSWKILLGAVTWLTFGPLAFGKDFAISSLSSHLAENRGQQEPSFQGRPIRFFFLRRDHQSNNNRSTGRFESSRQKNRRLENPSRMHNPSDSRSGLPHQDPVSNKYSSETKNETSDHGETVKQEPPKFFLTDSLSIYDFGQRARNEPILPRFGEDSALSIRWRSAPEPDNDRFLGTYVLNGKEICGYSLISNNLASGESLLLGKYPEILESSFLENSFLGEERFQFDPDSALRHFMSSQNAGKSNLMRQIRDCLFIKNEQLLAAKEFLVSSDAASYRVWVSNDEILSWESLFFQASIEAYEKNVLDGARKIYEISTDNSGYLTNNKFETRTNHYARAFEPSGVFHYLDADPLFRETSAFLHANLALDYFSSLGFSDPLKAPIILNLNVVVSGSLNNAIYQPPETTETGRATISIANGDGINLMNLATDIDVVTHELGHHVVFKYLKSTSGESLVLHEGLADFFAFAQTSDPCLGESICPVSSFRCWVEAQCLRTADNDIHYGNGQYDLLASHQKSQIVSGLLWDLHKLHDVALTEISQTVMKAISFLNPSSDIQDFITAYALADQFLRGGRDLCALKEVAIGRGFEEQFSEVDCKVLSSWPQINGQAGSQIKVVSGSSAVGVPSSSLPEKELRRKTSGFCAFQQGSKINYFSILLLMLPFISAVLRRLADNKC